MSIDGLFSLVIVISKSIGFWYLGLGVYLGFVDWDFSNEPDQRRSAQPLDKLGASESTYRFRLIAFWVLSLDL